MSKLCLLVLSSNTIHVKLKPQESLDVNKMHIKQREIQQRLNCPSKGPSANEGRALRRTQTLNWDKPLNGGSAPSWPGGAGPFPGVVMSPVA